MQIPFTAPEYDAFVTHFADQNAGPSRKFTVEVFVSEGPASGTVFSIDDEGTAPPPDLGLHLARLLADLPEIDRALFVVCGVPIPAWAIAVFEEFRAGLASPLERLDLLGVDGYRWESYLLTPAAA
jgi:hypothetical protein